MKSRITQEARLKVEEFRSSSVRRSIRRLFRINPELTSWSIKQAEKEKFRLISSFKEAINIMNPDQ